MLAYSVLLYFQHIVTMSDRPETTETDVFKQLYSPTISSK